ncbi:hypothetical protein DLJ53_09230 [Acuticoccus sediminis]|uniref:Uncharacterized protein n=1 Tax=Acuticoccus sediminis TaxID=2184697 RepID=A0A8B2NNY1_9HYPH|nr:hypothetical protein DLJ53_09230 [Acuticoccus sediminis]
MADRRIRARSDAAAGRATRRGRRPAARKRRRWTPREERRTPDARPVPRAATASCVAFPTSSWSKSAPSLPALDRFQICRLL